MKKIIIRILSVLIILILGIILLWRWNATRSLPDHTGLISVPQLPHRVEIQFNSWGMPSVFAETENEMYFAMGWQHAADRLFQIEIIRRVSQGRLSEIFGRDALAFDKRIRRIGFYRQVDREINDVDVITKNRMQRYVDGINAYIDLSAAFPPEFSLLGFSPDKWEIPDIACIYLYQTWFSHALVNTENLDKKIMEKFPHTLSAYLLHAMPWLPPTVFGDEKLSLFDGVSYPLRMSFASNAFAVSAAKSTTGKAIFASDPHLQVNQLPGFWYAMGIHSDDGVNAVGITTPGLPFIAMGHNGRISWAFTVAGVDIIDYYAETLKKDGPLFYKTPDGWLPLQKITELIHIDGEEKPEIVTYYQTRHGVCTEISDSQAVAMHWAGYDFHLKDILPSLFQLNKARDFPAFQKIVTQTGALSANWLYADSSGNIGYQLGVPVPLRHFKNSFVLLPGEDETYDWDGYWPLAKTPHVYNPPSGWIATCNNQPVDFGDGDDEIPGFYDPYRIIRITELMKSRDRFSVEDLQGFQMDLIAPQVLRWKTLFKQLAIDTGHPDLAEQIEKWDGNTNGENSLPTLFYLWWEKIPEVFLQDDFSTFPKHVSASLIEAMLQIKDAPWVDDIKTNKKETWDEQVARAFTIALDEWHQDHWGERSTLTFDHLLAKSPLIAFLFDWNRGPYPYHGSPSTLNANFYQYDRKNNTFPVMVAPSMRMIVDYSHIDQSTLSLPAGESGHPYSDHYDDMIELWLQGGRPGLPFSWDASNRDMVEQLMLVPGKD